MQPRRLVNGRARLSIQQSTNASEPSRRAPPRPGVSSESTRSSLLKRTSLEAFTATVDGVDEGTCAVAAEPPEGLSTTRHWSAASHGQSTSRVRLRPVHHSTQLDVFDDQSIDFRERRSTKTKLFTTGHAPAAGLGVRFAAVVGRHRQAL